MFFLSSPTPAPASEPEALPNPFSSPVTTRQYVPPRSTCTDSHTRGNSYYSTKAYNRGYYTPHAPSPLRLESSPLRTARNANLMSSPTRSGGSKAKSAGGGGGGLMLSSSPPRCAVDGVDENWITDEVDGDGGSLGQSGFDNPAHSTPVGKLNVSMGESLFNAPTHSTPVGKLNFSMGERGSSSFVTSPPDSAPHPQATRAAVPAAAFSSPVGSSFSFAAPQPSSASQWELRSRESSPSTLLATQTARNREERKSRFLDRIRRRRDDQRSERVGDQVLRMDFVKERRGWEEQMARRAAFEAGVAIEEAEEEVVEEADMQNDTEFGAQEMSPTEEYDDLVRDYENGYEYEYERERGFDRQGEMMPEDEFEFPVDEADDEEYERLFREMEILSQQSVSQVRDIMAQEQQHPSQQGMEHRSGGGDAMDIS
ncbi:hypothetical protein CLCR_08626 [Cladophialophora carrionii]|uniref:Uncharacterized protein n=1 Tax=Cladophialophora carrionii TaxID=86049 RepID=A0A1C1CUJ5_9EURO|nr:hypothetical protein CLCR_08626 [Cladophialophora carrionii]